MPSPDDLHRLLIAGTAETLAAAGIAEWDDFGDGTAYTDETVWPIFQGPDFPDSPNRLIVITNGPQSFRGAQVGAQQQLRIRGPLGPGGRPAANRGDVDQQAERIRRTLTPNARPLTPPGGRYGPLHHVGAVSLQGDTLPLSRDAAGRFGFILNIRIRLRLTGNS